jgi:hypothetical protein
LANYVFPFYNPVIEIIDLVCDEIKYCTSDKEKHIFSLHGKLKVPILLQALKCHKKTENLLMIIFGCKNPKDGQTVKVIKQYDN